VKSKKIIISLAVVAVFIAVIIIMATVFAVKEVTLIPHKFSGIEEVPKDSPSPNDILKFTKGKSILFMSKDKVLDKLNAAYPDWHFFYIVKDFPNIINVHYIKRVAVVKLDISGNEVYLDSYGYVTEKPEGWDCINISSAFEHRDVTASERGKEFKFVDENNNKSLKIILEAIIASWRCKIEWEDMTTVLGMTDVFKFDSDGSLLINTVAGATIKVKTPEKNLTSRMIDAYSAYFNDKQNLQQEGVVLIVESNGNIIMPNNK